MTTTDGSTASGYSALAVFGVVRCLATALLGMGCVMTGTTAQGKSPAVTAEAVAADPALFTVWRPQTGYFYSRDVAGAITSQQWGVSTDIPVVGDYDGDGKKDYAVWRPSTGYWYIIQSSNGEVVSHQWGESTDVPVVGDFDGDGKADIAVWRPSTGYWYIIQSSNGAVVSHQWGAPTDKPVIGDFDGDGKTDIAVWRPSTGYWYIIQSSNGATVSTQWGASTDVPVIGDFDGDGKADVAVWRPSTGYWYIIQSSNKAVLAKQWGQAGDLPVPQDYDASGKTNIAVWRPSSGDWYVSESGNGATLVEQWGDSTDIPANDSVEPAQSYTIGGTVIGLEKGGTLHVLNGGDNYTVSGNGPFTLPTALNGGATFNVSVGTTPAGQVCAVQNGSGNVPSGNVTNVLVYCTYVQSAATLNGSYDGAGYNINKNLDLLSSGVSFNGAGTEGNTATLIQDSGGTVTTTTNSSNSAGSYTVVTTNAIPVLTTGGNNIGAIAGADDDEFFWLADASSADGGGFPALAVGVSPLLNGTVASIAGNWIAVGLDSGSDPQDFEGVLTFGANGSVSGTSTSLDVNYVVASNPYTEPAGSVTLSSGGQFSSGGGTLGYVSANGEFLFETYTANGKSPGLTVAVKQGTGVTAATLNGVYTVGSLSFNSATTGDGEVYTYFFDGAGHWSANYIENNNGSFSTETGISGTYSVTSTGALTLTNSGTGESGNAHTGGISADGNILVMANQTGGGAEDPRIYVGFRQ